MGFMKNMFNKAQEEIANSLKQSGTSGGTSSGSSQSAPVSNATNWEKSVSMLDGIVKQVVKVDPDGVDIVCFGGEDEVDWYRNIKNTKGLEEIVTDKGPEGACLMGAAMDEVINDAFDKDLTKRPVSVLVLTAGRPNDADELDATLKKTVNRLAESCDTCPLSITFVQIGDHPKATEYLSHLDDNIQAESASSGETFDLVDTIKDAEIQAAMSEIKGTKSSGKNGALIGAFAGAAMGVGGMYLYNKTQAKKRTEGWSGKWKISYDGEEIAVLDVVDHKDGNLTINGFPSGDALPGVYTKDEETGYTIQFQDPSGDDIDGTVEDEHAITWSDGTRWDEIPPDNGSFAKYAAAAAGGAATAGATGYLLDKKFFNKASKKDQCDYIIVLDRSAMMDPAAMRAMKQGQGEQHPMSKRKFSNKDMKFELTIWKNLPQPVRKACKELGYDKNKWDNSEEVDCQWEHWEDLTDEQRKAVKVIGWEEAAWDSHYQWTEWDELPKLQKKAARVAGYTEDNWQDWVEGLDEWWEDLGHKEKQGLAVMGWTKYSWDHQ